MDNTSTDTDDLNIHLSVGPTAYPESSLITITLRNMIEEVRKHLQRGGTHTSDLTFSQLLLKSRSHWGSRSFLVDQVQTLQSMSWQGVLP